MAIIEHSWRELIADAMLKRPPPVVAQQFLKRWNGAGEATLLRCSDGNDYVVKSRNSAAGSWRMLFNDQIAARLGALIGAPVPKVALVDVPAALISVNPDADDLGHAKPGLAHGSLRIACLADVEVQEVRIEGNRDRFASLAVFFAWMYDTDRQYHYKEMPPLHVFSVDHGEFFYGSQPGTNWNVATLGDAPTADLRKDMVGFGLVKADLSEPIERLKHVTKPAIAAILGIPPCEWEVTLDERVAMANYLWRRREELLLCFDSLV